MENAVDKYVTGIYQIYNKQTKKKYIGKSIDVRKRIDQHFRELKLNQHHNKFLQKDFNKYGEDYFQVSLLIECNEKDLDAFESQYCYENDVWNRKSGYNIAKLRRLAKAKTKTELIKDEFLEMLFSDEKLNFLIQKNGEVEIYLRDLEEAIEGFDYALIKKILKWISLDDREKYKCVFEWRSSQFGGIILIIRSQQKQVSMDELYIKKLETLFE